MINYGFKELNLNISTKKIYARSGGRPNTCDIVGHNIKLNHYEIKIF